MSLIVDLFLWRNPIVYAQKSRPKFILALAVDSISVVAAAAAVVISLIVASIKWQVQAGALLTPALALALSLADLEHRPEVM